MDKLTRLYEQVAAIEKVVRSIRLDILETMGADDLAARAGIPIRLPLPNDLAKLVNSNVDLSRTKVAPYERFWGDAYLAFKPDEVEVLCSTETVGVMSAGLQHRVLTVELQDRELPQWLTLEAKLPLDRLSDKSVIGYTVVAASESASILLRPTCVSFYVNKSDRDYQVGHRYFPSVATPAEISQTFDLDALDILPLSEIKELKLLIHLPVSERLRFKLYFFDVYAV